MTVILDKLLKDANHLLSEVTLSIGPLHDTRTKRRNAESLIFLLRRHRVMCYPFRLKEIDRAIHDMQYIIQECKQTDEHMTPLVDEPNDTYDKDV